MLLTESQHEKWGEGGCQATTHMTPRGEVQIVPQSGGKLKLMVPSVIWFPKSKVALLRVVLLRDMYGKLLGCQLLTSYLSAGLCSRCVSFKLSGTFRNSLFFKVLGVSLKDILFIWPGKAGESGKGML